MDPAWTSIQNTTTPSAQDTAHHGQAGGSQSREERRAVEERFRNDPLVVFLVATDAAGEGINLQRAHLMINYDLPWNPNRLEQRFGRIHRIGQNEVCHLWNLVAGETREGHVYERLLEKIQEESKALQGQVFDVLGSLFEGTSLRSILVEAIRYGDQPDVRARLEQAIDNAVDRERVRERREALIDKTLAAVQERLTKEINYWDARAATLRSQEKAGKTNARLNSQIAQGRADGLAARLARRKEELAQERQIAASPLVVIGGALVIPVGLLLGEQTPPEMLDSRITGDIAMQAVMAAEIALGNDPRDVSRGKLGYDVESFDPRAGRLRFIEVKGHRKGSQEVFVTRNEFLTALNVPEQFIPALVEVDEGQACEPHYV